MDRRTTGRLTIACPAVEVGLCRLRWIVEEQSLRVAQSVGRSELSLSKGGWSPGASYDASEGDVAAIVDVGRHGAWGGRDQVLLRSLHQLVDALWRGPAAHAATRNDLRVPYMYSYRYLHYADKTIEYRYEYLHYIPSQIRP